MSNRSSGTLYRNVVVVAAFSDLVQICVCSRKRRLNKDALDCAEHNSVTLLHFRTCNKYMFSNFVLKGMQRFKIYQSVLVIWPKHSLISHFQKFFAE